MEAPRTDAELVRAIARGNDRAFAELVDRHGAWALGVATRFVGNRADAEDAVQEALVFLIERSGRLVISDSLRPWLYPVIRNRAQQRARDQRPVSHVGHEESSADALAPPDPDERLRRAVASLSDPILEVLMLRIVDGLSVAQTATALEIPEGTVKSRLAAALASLRKDPSLGDF